MKSLEDALGRGRGQHAHAAPLQKHRQHHRAANVRERARSQEAATLPHFAVVRDDASHGSPLPVRACYSLGPACGAARVGQQAHLIGHALKFHLTFGLGAGERVQI